MMVSIILVDGLVYIVDELVCGNNNTMIKSQPGCIGAILSIVLVDGLVVIVD